MRLDPREATAIAHARTSDVHAQIAAAYACDRAGEEALAIEFYDAAAALGVPAAEHEEFSIGYGSTLRNVGRADEAVAVLAALVAAQPNNQAAQCFYALALHAAKRPALAVAQLLSVTIEQHASSPSLSRYRDVLLDYCDALTREPD